MGTRAGYGWVGEAFLSLCMVLATLAMIEVVLRLADFAELRETLPERTLGYGYDAELGWFPVPGSSSEVVTFRTTQFRHNSLGLRDDEFNASDARPTIMFLGDSFVWGLDSQVKERFTDLLKPKLPDYKIVAAGVSGYGTDQEYLLLKRLWPAIKPAVVVLIFCAGNDRLDNTSNRRLDDYFKPYFVTRPDGSLAVMGQPVPRSQLLRYREDWLVHNLWLARLAADGYVRLRYRRVLVPDPTEQLVGAIRDFVDANGARFMVGIQSRDDALASYLDANRIPYVKLEGAPYYTEGGWGPHWKPEGHQFVAERIQGMLVANNVAKASTTAKGR